MTEVKDGIQNTDGEQKTPIQNNPTDEKNNQNQEEDTSHKNEGTEEQEEVKISKAEFEKIQKKAKDFDGIIEKQRLEKLRKPKESENSEPEKIDQAKLEEIIEAKVSEKLGLRNQAEYETNLTEAYRDFIKANPWADSDETIASISKDFSGQGAVSKSDLLVRIGQAAERVYPAEYEQSKIARIKSQVLAGEHNIDAGDTGGGGASRAKQLEHKKTLTAEQLELCRKSGNKPEDVYPEYFTN